MTTIIFAAPGQVSISPDKTELEIAFSGSVS
jgi:hypothetical protein